MKIHIVKNPIAHLSNLLDQRIIQVIECLPMEPAITVVGASTEELEQLRPKFAECSRYVCGRSGFALLPTDAQPSTENLFCFDPEECYQTLKQFKNVWLTPDNLKRILELECQQFIEQTFGLNSCLVKSDTVFGRSNLYDIDGNSDQYIDLEQVVNQLPLFSTTDIQQLNTLTATYVLKVLQ